MANIAIYDYGAGNLYSLKIALEKNGASKVSIIHDLVWIEDFDGIILPGVGNFDPAIKSLEKEIDKLKMLPNMIPLLGICLGMEMLFEKSEEGNLPGLSIFKGKVISLPKGKVKVPHMGWNNLNIVKPSKLLDGIKDQAWVYFVHSYQVSPFNKKIITAEAEYGNNIVAVIEEKNIFGTQFHPEKSGDIGSLMLKNFLRVCDEMK